jgi:1-acyl-sn-glycerol-3-phosphate acyltransferase
MKPTAKLSFKIAAVIAGILLKVLTRTEVRGKENMPPGGPIIAVCNHINFLDPLIHIYNLLPRDSIFLAKEELFKFWPIPIFAILMRITEALPVPRRGTTEERQKVQQKAMAVLAAGNVLGIYPEGTRSKDAQLNFANPGAARLALRCNVPLIPISIYGSEKFRGWGCFSRPHVVLTFGKPFNLPDQEREPSFTRIQKLSDLIMKQIRDILPPQYHGKYREPSAPVLTGQENDSTY